jgi:hypothetical protein
LIRLVFDMVRWFSLRCFSDGRSGQGAEFGLA